MAVRPEDDCYRGRGGVGVFASRADAREIFSRIGKVQSSRRCMKETADVPAIVNMDPPLMRRHTRDGNDAPLSFFLADVTKQRD